MRHACGTVRHWGLEGDADYRGFTAGTGFFGETSGVDYQVNHRFFGA